MANCWAIAFGALVLLVAAFVLPPLSLIGHHYAVQYLPPSRAMHVAQFFEGRIQSAILVAAVQNGLFEHLAASGPQRLSEIAKALQLDRRALRVVAENLILMHFVSVVDRAVPDDETIDITPVTRAHLLRSSAESFVDFFVLQSHPSFNSMADNLPFVLKNGKLPPNSKHAESPDYDFWPHFARSTGTMAKDTGNDLVSVLKKHNVTPPASSGNFKVLDSACGSGEHGATVAAAFPSALVTFFDLPHTLHESKRLLTEKHPDMTSRFSYQPGDLFNKTLPKDTFDVTLAMHILHHFTYERCVELAKSYFAATKSGGYIVVGEMARSGEALPSHLTDFNTFPHIFNAIMLVSTQGGSAFTVGELSQMLTTAGFRDVVTVSFFPKPYTFLVARKP
eukprot:gnl/Spiro4/2636_TR1276_c0_g1_i1.p1 gnl/Spiro4/2636_TR1276_c0_g1~~gnl/Spiro4/2636_TR1276_c0_g1_i1.p1  ORF type:complete len:393 (+),score=113.88 gnl/Spiro4/2636_TR1276_c0_g1_i1:37-1215(+)